MSNRCTPPSSSISSGSRGIPRRPPGPPPGKKPSGATVTSSSLPRVQHTPPQIPRSPPPRRRKRRKAKDKVVESGAKREQLRTKVSQEFLSSEQAYVEHLRCIVDLYITPLTARVETSDAILTTDEINSIFSSIKILLGLNEVFCNELKERVQFWTTDSSLGDVICKFSPYFKMYTEYVRNHGSAVLLLEHNQLLNNSKFEAFCAEAKANPRAEGQSLDSFLIKPIQRIPRYKLLVAELLKRTAEDHPDIEPLKTALEAVDKVARHINTEIERRENRDIILAIQSEFQGTIEFLTPDRRFIRKGPLKKRGRSSDVEYEFFLFSDLLVYASASKAGWKLKLHRQLPINSAFFIEDLPDLRKTKNRFKIISTEKSFIVTAKDFDTKIAWMTDICNSIQAIQKVLATRGQQKAGVDEGALLAPVWQSDHSSTFCMYCKRRFSLFNRRHHCRKCGVLCCNLCSGHRVLLTGSDKKYPVRVCDICFRTLAPQNTSSNYASIAASLRIESSKADILAQSLKKSLAPFPFQSRRLSRFPPSTPPRPPQSTDLKKRRDGSGKRKEGVIGHSLVLRSTSQRQKEQTHAKINNNSESSQLEQQSHNRGEKKSPPPPPFHSPPSQTQDQVQTSPPQTQTQAQTTPQQLYDAIPHRARFSSILQVTKESSYFRAVFAFHGRFSDELSFVPGDIIKVCRKDDSGWWSGSLVSTKKNDTGLFPGNYVEPRNDPICYMRAKAKSYSVSLSTEELAFSVGDIIRVFLQHNSGWWLGENTSSGQLAWFLPDQMETIAEEDGEEVDSRRHYQQDEGDQQQYTLSEIDDEFSSDDDEEEERFLRLGNSPNTSTSSQLRSKDLVSSLLRQKEEEVYSTDENEEEDGYEENVNHQQLEDVDASIGAATTPTAYDEERKQAKDDSVDEEIILHARVLYSYEPDHSKELALVAGSTITVLKQHESGWWRGEHDGAIGWFPAAFVTLREEEIISPDQAADEPSETEDVKLTEECSTQRSETDDQETIEEQVTNIPHSETEDLEAIEEQAINSSCSETEDVQHTEECSTQRSETDEQETIEEQVTNIPHSETEDLEAIEEQTINSSCSETEDVQLTEECSTQRSEADEQEIIEEQVTNIPHSETEEVLLQAIPENAQQAVEEPPTSPHSELEETTMKQESHRQASHHSHASSSLGLSLNRKPRPPRPRSVSPRSSLFPANIGGSTTLSAAKPEFERTKPVGLSIAKPEFERIKSAPGEMSTPTSPSTTNSNNNRRKTPKHKPRRSCRPILSCTKCDCDSFVAHAFKKGVCNKCFHNVSAHRAK